MATAARHGWGIYSAGARREAVGGDALRLHAKHIRAAWLCAGQRLAPLGDARDVRWAETAGAGHPGKERGIEDCYTDGHWTIVVVGVRDFSPPKLGLSFAAVMHSSLSLPLAQHCILMSCPDM